MKRKKTKPERIAIYRLVNRNGPSLPSLERRRMPIIKQIDNLQPLIPESKVEFETLTHGRSENTLVPWWIYQNTFKLEQEIFIKPGLQARNTKKKTKN